MSSVSHVRVPFNKLSPERLDIGFYTKEYFEALSILESSNVNIVEIGDITEPWCFGAYALCNNIVWSNSNEGLPYIKAEALGSPLINFDGLAYITKETHKLLTKSQLKAGDIIVSTSGTIGLCAVIPDSIKVANSNQDTIKFNPSNKGFDNYFVVAWIASKYGQIILKREAGGAIQQHIYLSNFRRIPLLNPDRAVQNYIGDKVRLAEKLRERSKELEQQGRQEFNDYFGSFKPIPFKKNYQTLVSQLDNRIDTWFYNPRFLWAVQAIKDAQAELTPLGKIATQITNGGTPRNARFGAQGIPWIRGKDFEHGDIENIDSLPLLDFISEQTIKRSRLKVGDIILSIKGTVGDVAVVDELLEGCNTNQDVAKIEIGNLEDANFIASFFESELGKVLIEQQVYGAVNAFFSLENLRLFGVPAPSSVKAEFKSKVSGLRYKSILYKRLSQVLTNVAKYLVEALIEGKLTETELKNAQTALQKGDIEPDKAILAKLTRQGYDIPNQPPLFPDLDTLYEAIKEINLTSE